MLCALAGGASAAPRWSDPPRALSGTFLATPAGGEVVVTFAAPVEGARPLRLDIELRAAGAPAPAAAIERDLDGRWVTARWPASVAAPGAALEARFCAEDASGRACAGEAARFVAPGPAAPPACQPRHAPLAGGLLLGGALLALATLLRQVRRRAARLT